MGCYVPPILLKPSWASFPFPGRETPRAARACFRAPRDLKEDSPLWYTRCSSKDKVCVPQTKSRGRRLSPGSLD